MESDPAFHSLKQERRLHSRDLRLVPCRLLALASRLRPGAGPQQRAAAEAGLALALRLGLPPAALLAALQVRDLGSSRPLFHRISEPSNQAGIRQKKLLPCLGRPVTPVYRPLVIEGWLMPLRVYRYSLRVYHYS